MFVRLPDRIKVLHYVGFALMLGMFQLLQGSDPFCVGCVFLFVVISADAFNRCGGLMWPSGSYVFFLAILTVLIGAAWKVVLWEPFDRNMQAPQLTMIVYTAGMAMVWVAAELNRRLRTAKPLLRSEVPPQHQMRSALGCFIVGAAIAFSWPVLSFFNLEQLYSMLLQINLFLPLSIFLAVYYRTRQTGGKSSYSVVAAIALVLSFLIGMLAFSKQGMFTPFVSWILGALGAGYYVRFRQALAVVFVALISFFLLVPYAQYGRNHREEYESPVAALIHIATNPEDMLEKGEQEDNNAKYKFFDTPQGLFGRLTTIPLDDAVISYSDGGHYEGWIVLQEYVINLVPHILLPNKPVPRYGNKYAHEIGVLQPDDMTTGVSFSPQAEGFHIAGWAGVLVAMPVIVLFQFWICDSMAGSLWHGPWALYYIVIFTHASAEGGLGSPLYFAWYGLVGLFFAVIVATKIAPLIGTLLMGPERPVGLTSAVRTPSIIHSMSRRSARNVQ